MDLFFAFTAAAVQNPERFRLYLEQMDDAFFHADPGPLTQGRQDTDRPLLVGVGLKMWGDVTLVEATRDLDVDVRITAFLKDAAPTGRAVPGPLPDNMPSRFYAWRELVNLYTTADIVVVPLCATACSVGKPIIATETQALRYAFATPNSVYWVRPEGPETLCAAVETLIAALKGRADMAASAARAQKEHHGFQPALETMTAALEALWARKERDRIWHQNSAPAGCGVSSWK